LASSDGSKAVSTVGIDFGTTNSAIALDGRPLELHHEGTVRALLPSVVAFLPSGARLVGEAARARRMRDPKNTIYSSKRILGQGWFSTRARKFQRQYPFELGEKNGGPAFKTRAGVHTPEEIAAMILAALTERARLEPRGLEAVVGLPTVLGPQQRAATIAATQQVGFAPVRTVLEPVATALAYSDGCSRKLGKVAVYDFGGGTFDLAVLDCSSWPFRVLAHGGDAYLGGDDIDRALAKAVARAMLEKTRWDLRSDPTVFAQLVSACERAKIELCTAETARIGLGEVDEAAPVPDAEIVLDREQLTKLSAELVRSTFLTCDSTLGDARIRTSEIDTVLLAGGTTKLPMVREGVRKYFGREPRADVDPLTVVAIGASMAPPD
jgi:molecular chaperone DnaK